jgi:hypothetical protein
VSSNVGETLGVPPSESPEQAGAAETLALAERMVRWEDDVSPAELRIFTELYKNVLRAGAFELAAVAKVSHPVGPARQDSQARETSASEARTQLLLLRHEAFAVVRRVQVANAATRSLRTKHWRRYLAALLVLVGLSVCVKLQVLLDALDVGNVSRGKPWVASSTYEKSTPLSGTLGDFTAQFFFHTEYESSPWLEVDLGAPTPVRRVIAVNRKDCCSLRAVPLAIETSLDHQTWKRAALRRSDFSVWRQGIRVGPVRWVRLRVLRESNFHLEALTIRM